MWESPIQMISEDIIKDIVRKQDECLMEAVHRVGFDVNKEELEKALLYDRNQWERGYADGKMAGYHLRDTEIVRCGECKYRDADDFCTGRGYPNVLVPDDGFCDKGERNEE